MPIIPAHMLPGPSICIRDLIEFPLPVIAQDMHHPFLLRTGNLSAVFVATEPTWSERHDIVTIEVPVKKLLDRLAKTWKRAFADGARAVQVVHTAVPCNKTLPLWIIPYWQAIAEARRSQERWQRVERFLIRPVNSWLDQRVGRPSVAAVMRAALEMLYQRNNDEMLQGLADPEPIERLAAFASHEWLSTWHMDVQLALLRRDLARAGRHEVLIPSAYIYKNIFNAFNDKDNYGYPKHHQTAFKLGVRVAHHSFDVATVANVDDNNWVAFVISCRDDTVYYGDPMGGAVHPKFFLVIGWWTFVHFARTFKWATMEMTKQTDWFSCGILGGNGLRHYLLGSLHPLAAAGQPGADAERGEMLAQILLEDRVRRACFESHSMLLKPPRVAISRWHVPLSKSIHRQTMRTSTKVSLFLVSLSPQH